MSEIKAKKKIVMVGGGTGTYTVLTGLKKYCEDVDLTAVVAMTDSGGSTGRLRDEFGYLPVGDVRMALVALAGEGSEHETLLRRLFLHRFATNGNFSGHNFGNLFLMALTDILGSEEEAIRAAAHVLRICGTVLPITHEKVELTATYDDGSVVVGEHAIDEPLTGAGLRRIVSLGIQPEAHLNAEVQGVLKEADLIVMGPGDLYTSILANSVVSGFKEALGGARGKIVYISNLMTKRGQTTGMSLGDHVFEVSRYTGRFPDTVVANATPLPVDLLERYAAEGEYPVALDTKLSHISDYVQGDFLASEEVVHTKGDIVKRSLIRHDSDKLARALMEILMG